MTLEEAAAIINKTVRRTGSKASWRVKAIIDGKVVIDGFTRMDIAVDPSELTPTKKTMRATK